ncbi:MAG: NUDIX hydrolase [Betaproteobacteria bacterium]
MIEWNSERRWRRYLQLAESNPEFFTDCGASSYEILMAIDAVARAQSDAGCKRSDEGLSANDTRVGVLGEDPFLTALRDAVRFPDGTLGLYNRLLVPAGVTMLPFLEGEIVLLDRFRHGTRSWHLEAPRGAVSGNESVEQGARRELAEEIGATGVALTGLGLMHPTTGCSNEVHHLFMARVENIGAPDLHEAIRELRVLPVIEFERMAADGTITDGPTLSAFLRARLRGLV